MGDPMTLIALYSSTRFTAFLELTTLSDVDVVAARPTRQQGLCVFAVRNWDRRGFRGDSHRAETAEGRSRFAS